VWVNFTHQNSTCIHSLVLHDSSSSSSVWGRRLPTECTAALRGLLYEPRFSFPLSSPEALNVNRRERPLSAKVGTMGDKCQIKFSHTIATSAAIVGFFYMPQSCDMGPTVLLPLRRKPCWGFFRPNNPTASAGFELANLGTRGQHANH
jgi:hypothetical protein